MIDPIIRDTVDATVRHLQAGNARLREQLRCVRDNLSKGMSKSMQKLQAREIDNAMKEVGHE